MVRPSVMASTLASWPSSRSSSTRRFPAAPKIFLRPSVSTAATASSRREQTSTPLPPASPSAFTTIGTSSRSLRNLTASSTLAEGLVIGRGDIGAAEEVLAKDLAAFQLGGGLVRARRSAIRRPRRQSTMPAARGPSGPTMVSPTSFSRANLTRAGKSSTARGTFSPSRSLPALPGATNTRSARGLCPIFQARACSRPPLPTMRTFIRAIVVGNCRPEKGAPLGAGRHSPIRPQGSQSGGVTSAQCCLRMR